MVQCLPFASYGRLEFPLNVVATTFGGRSYDHIGQDSRWTSNSAAPRPNYHHMTHNREQVKTRDANSPPGCKKSNRVSRTAKRAKIRAFLQSRSSRKFANWPLGRFRILTLCFIAHRYHCEGATDTASMLCSRWESTFMAVLSSCP
jgi:hypothetical protein